MKKLLTTLALIFLSGCSKPPAKDSTPPAVTVTKPTVCTLPLYREYPGNVFANISVQIKAQVSGILTSKNFIEGQDVKQGDLLLTIDNRPYIASLAKAQAVLAQNIASLKYSEETTQRYSKLVQEEFVSQLTYDQYVTNVLTDEAIIKQNLAEIDTAKINLSYCSITAPMDCVTGKLQVKEGNYVDSNADTALVLLNQIKPILVDFYIPDRDLPLLQHLQQANQLKVFAYVNRDYSQPHVGLLTLIDNQVNTGTGSILLEATFPNEDKALWPGEFVDVRVILGEKTDALLLPSEAVQIGQQGKYIYIMQPDQTVKLQTVVTGQRYDSMTMLESGLTADDVVVVEGQLNLYPGVKVAIKNP